MGWFDEQIEFRKRHEIELLSDSFQNMAKSVTGHRMGDGFVREGADVKDAISQLLKYFDIKEREIPGKLKDLEDKLDYLLSPTGILYREVILEKGWHQDAMGAMIATLKEDGSVITILPGSSGGHVYIDPHTGRRVKVTRSVEGKIGREAFVFYKPLPMRTLKMRDLWRFMAECLTGWDLLSFILSAGAITLVGMLLPKLNKLLMGTVVENKSYQLLAAVMMFMLCVTVGNLVFTSVKALLLQRIYTKLSVQVSAATMMRVLALPTGFFREYTAGELNQYLSYMNSLCGTMVDSLLSTGITGVFSLVYLTQIFSYAKSLVLPSLLVTITTLAVSMLAARLQMQVSKERMKLAAKEKGVTYSLISGIQKIRLSGAENRAFVKWANLFAEEAALNYNPPMLIKLNTVLTTAISTCGTIVLYYIAIKTRVSVADYYAFNTAYAYIASAFAALASVATTVASIRPTLDLIKPLMEAVPESSEGLETVTALAGGIELSHVSFRYTPDGPMILDDLSLNIPARQYVAIVGKTGCGKSTLMRLLLGFEQPTKGSIFFDKKDTKRLDMRSVRKQIGTVMQDGKLFSGSIFENISISAPTLTPEGAWEAAEIAGIADDIRKMPMGMHTVISEGAGGISGGQRQRLMIARAVAPKPKVLFLDEATSALDNITQKNVADALDRMRCTRIVIAHRLSTIKHCDRIIVLDGGHIIEDGSYEELIAANGYFASLVERQRI